MFCLENRALKHLDFSMFSIRNYLILKGTYKCLKLKIKLHFKYFFPFYLTENKREKESFYNFEVLSFW